MIECLTPRYGERETYSLPTTSMKSPAVEAICTCTSDCSGILTADGRNQPPLWQRRTKARFLLQSTVRIIKAQTALRCITADIYRSVGILRQLLPFLASIGLAVGFYATLLVGPVAIPPQSAPILNGISVFGFTMQAVCFLLIIILSRLGKRKHWHRKFLDYRMLAEMLRQMKYLGPSGLVIRGLNISAYSSDVNVSWVNWYFRAVVREAGLPNLNLSAADLARWADTTVGEILRGQVEYHRSNASAMQRIASRLERFGLRVYYIGIAIMILRAAVFYFATADTHAVLTEIQKSYLTKVFNMLSMVTPLFSSLAFGLSAQEGFASLQRRSEDMLLRLSSMEKQMNRRKTEDFNAFVALSQALTGLMLSEFSDWNMFIRTKPISDH